MRRFTVVGALLLSAASTYHVQALAVGSKQRGKKASSTGGGGFGAKESTINHTPDTSETTTRLVQFLKAQNAKGLNKVEIGFGDEWL